MVLEGHLKGSLVVILNECLNITGDLTLNSFFRHVLLLLETELCTKTRLYSSLSVHPIVPAMFIILYTYFYIPFFAS